MMRRWLTCAVAVVYTGVYVNADAHESCTVLCGLLLFPQNML